MYVKLITLFVIVSAIVGLSEDGSLEKLRPAFQRVRVDLLARLRRKF